MNANETLCGARRPGWERPGPGRHRLPCVRDIGHDEDHLDAFGQTWRRCCDDCGTTDGPLEGNTTAEADGSVWDGHLCGPCLDAATAPEPVLQEVLQEVDEPVLQDQERRPVRMCVRCSTITDAPVVVSEVHANSGPGFNVYACSACAPRFPPVPSAIDLLPLRRPERGGR
ncbi:hypothetical protein ACFO9E_13365 [Streptomyces maoxianensis]|uniref:Uncharacterized protein n=1 Tax=Streptomyces maoxianensis TaxID=1459942 RepID=A0ABV9G841_9ACTN